MGRRRCDVLVKPRFQFFRNRAMCAKASRYSGQGVCAEIYADAKVGRKGRPTLPAVQTDDSDACETGLGADGSAGVRPTALPATMSLSLPLSD